MLLAAIGGIARYLHIYMQTGNFKIGFFIAHVFISAFSGYMFAEFALFIGIKETGLFLFAGIGGFLGTKALEVIENHIFSITNNDIKKAKEKDKTPKNPK